MFKLYFNKILFIIDCLIFKILFYFFLIKSSQKNPEKGKILLYFVNFNNSFNFLIQNYDRKLQLNFSSEQDLENMELLKGY